jgi:IclR family acetate operon transcriptional repressor
MRDLSAASGHSVVLSVRRSDFCRHVMAVEGPLYLESRWRLVVRLELNATASGKLLLAFAPPDSREAIVDRLPLPALTPNTITDPGELRDELDRIRAAGFAEARGETVLGLVALAVPVLGHGETVIASLGIIAPESALAARDVPAAVDASRAKAMVVSSHMGARLYAPPAHD